MTRPSVVVVSAIILVVARTATVTAAYPMLTHDRDEDCVPCVDLFSKLEAGSEGRLSQVVEIKMRGEPKTGTSMMALRAEAILEGTCKWLGSMYGSETCTVTRSAKWVLHLLFNPRLSPADSACSCGAIDRVSITLDTELRHMLPVEDSCPWSHPNCMWRGPDVCRSLDGEIRNYADLQSCFEEAGCELTDTRLQFTSSRDPRPMTVSAYFHWRRFYPEVVKGITIDEYVLDNLAWTCQWVALRYILFEGVMAENSSVFWFEDATTDVVGWHLQWLKFAGLHLPMTLVQRMAEVAVGATRHSVNIHPGGAKASPNRDWKDEVGAHVVDAADEILRTFLPPVLLGRLGVSLV